jgi:hypothetical protein
VITAPPSLPEYVPQAPRKEFQSGKLKLLELKGRTIAGHPLSQFSLARLATGVPSSYPQRQGCHWQQYLGNP